MKRIYPIMLITAALLTVWSCSKEFLDTAPTSSVDEASIFSSTENAMMAINGIHRMMYEGNSSGTTTSWNGQGGYPTFCLHLAFMADDVVWTYDNVMYKFCAQLTHHRDLSHKYNDLNYYWKLFYRVINNANKVIEAYDAGMPGSEQYGYLAAGEAYAYRAFALFELVQAWAKRYDPAGNNTQPGVILRLTPSPDPMARSSVEETYAQILADLGTAFEYLDKCNIKKVNKSHFDKYVVRGIRARVYLTMGKWSEAAADAEYVIKNSGAKLQADTYTTVVNRASDATNTEWLWGLIAKEDNSQGGGNRSWHNFISNNYAAYNRSSPRAILNLLYKTIPESDVRKRLWVEDPYTAKELYLPGSTSSRLACWMSQKWIVDDNQTQNDYHDVAYMRLPEMYLIAAEGYARAGQNDKAQDMLYTIAHHRDPQYAKPTSTGEALAEAVIWQRRVELWAEHGARWHDLKRLDQAIDRGPKPRDGYNQGGTANGWGTNVKVAPWKNSKVAPLDPLASNYNMYGEQMPGEKARTTGKPSVDEFWQWLIPYNEIASNPLCEQNPL